MSTYTACVRKARTHSFVPGPILLLFFFLLFAQKLLIVVTKGIGNMKKIVIMVGITTSSNKTPVNIGSALGHVRT